jgi:hypothetical protein
MNFFESRLTAAVSCLLDTCFPHDAGLTRTRTCIKGVWFCLHARHVPRCRKLFSNCEDGVDSSVNVITLWTSWQLHAFNSPDEHLHAAGLPILRETGWVPQYKDGAAAGQAIGRVYTFPTQFNDWGQRTNSGVSLVAGGKAWRHNPRVDLWTNARVEGLEFDTPVPASR